MIINIIIIILSLFLCLEFIRHSNIYLKILNIYFLTNNIITLIVLNIIENLNFLLNLMVVLNLLELLILIIILKDKK